MNTPNYFQRFAHVKSTLVLGDPTLTPAPFLTIWIPTYNRDEFLREAINSVLAQENPENVPFEILILDNNGVAGKESIAYKVVESYHDPRLLLYQNSDNTGLFGNWNRAYELARAPWCAMLHDDDLLFPHYLKTVVPFLRAENAPDILGSTDAKFKKAVSEIKPNFDTPPYLVNITNDRFLKKYLPIGIAGLILRKSMILELGGYNADFYPSADWELYPRALANGYKIACVAGPHISAYRAALNASAKPDTRVHFTVANYKIWTQYKINYSNPIRAWCMDKKRKFRIFITQLRLSHKASPERIAEARAMLTPTDYIIGYLSPKSWIAFVKNLFAPKREV